VSGTPARAPDHVDHHGAVGTGHAPARAAAAHSTVGPRTYLVVAAFLLAITVMEVWIFYVPALARVLVPILLILSTLKFALVAMFYMHLKFDHAWFSYVFVGPLIIAIGLAVALLWLFHHLGTTGPGAAGAG
jgi:cytochrome c oxidase subunit IV